MKTITFLITYIFLVSSCTPDDTIETPPSPTNVLSYLALGDSYTIGQSVAATMRWPSLLVDSLRVDDISMLSPTYVATTGWRTDNLTNGIANSSLNSSYDLVSLLIGVNNQFQGGSISTYETEFESLLDKAIELAGGNNDKVFVLSIPDYAYTPYGQSTSNPQMISTELDEFNAINKSITEAKGVAYFDITPISRAGNDRPELVATDGLHPSGQQYTEWMRLIYSEVKALVVN